MTARKKPQPEPPAVTIAELLLALATYPLDAVVTTGENRGGGGEVYAWIEGEPFDVWTGNVWERPNHRPGEIIKVVQRSDPMDDFAAAKEFLEWLQTQRYGMPHEATGGGHNEPTTYRDLDPATLAEEFARRAS